MDIPALEAVKNIPFIVLGIWPVNLLTLWAQGHAWSWEKTPQATMDLWEWGAFVSCSLVILIEMGVRMFYARAVHRRKLQQAREEGRAEGRTEGRAEAREMITVLNAAARTNPDLLPQLLQEYQTRYQNRATEP